MRIKEMVEKTKKLLIVEQLLLVSVIDYVPRTVLKIYTLMSGCKKKLIFKTVFSFTGVLCLFCTNWCQGMVVFLDRI